jgi:hypothetical protein
MKKRRVCEKRLCESLNPIVKGIPTGKAWDNNKLWSKIPSTKGFPPKRHETTTSCGLKSHPQRDSHRKGSRQHWVVAWVSIMITNGDGSQVNVCGSCLKISWHELMKMFHDKYVLIKGQGARVKICIKLWLKQLRVAVSTMASMPSGSSPQNLRTNFVDLRHNIWSFQKLAKISRKRV